MIPALRMNPDLRQHGVNIYKSDILIFPDIHAGNLVYKSLVHMVPNIKNGNILTGTKAPVILTSRSDTKDVKVNSIALAAVVSENMKKNNG